MIEGFLSFIEKYTKMSYIYMYMNKKLLSICCHSFCLNIDSIFPVKIDI